MWGEPRNKANSMFFLSKHSDFSPNHIHYSKHYDNHLNTPAFHHLQKIFIKRLLGLMAWLYMYRFSRTDGQSNKMNCSPFHTNCVELGMMRLYLVNSAKLI